MPYNTAKANHSLLKLKIMSSSKKYTVKSSTSESQPVVTATSKVDALAKIRVHRPETKQADVVRFN